MGNLVKRLREPPFGTETSERNLMSAAADAIEALEAQLAKAERLGAERILGHFLAALPLDRIITAGGSVQDLIDGIKQVVQERDTARRATLEEAAKVAEDWRSRAYNGDHCQTIADRTAYAIRALAEKP